MSGFFSARLVGSRLVATATCAVIAYAGSWNRKEKSGYRITTVTLDGNKAVSYEPFATGFNRNDEVFGRPVDLLLLEDGSFLVSDDFAGAIYRLSYVVK